MADYFLSAKAIEDLNGIWFYTEREWSEQQADRYYNLLLDTCRKIADSPTAYGIKYRKTIEGLYGCRVKSHTIVYRILETGDTAILRILHRRMDIMQHVK